MSEHSIKIETASIEDLPQILELVMELFEMQGEFPSNETLQEQALRLIVESPNRGRIFVMRNEHCIIGIVTLLFTISTAVGGMVILLEDFIVHPGHRGQGYGQKMLDHVSTFAKEKNFKQVTLLTDKFSIATQEFFKKQGFNHSNMIPMRMKVE